MSHAISAQTRATMLIDEGKTSITQARAIAVKDDAIDKITREFLKDRYIESAREIGSCILITDLHEHAKSIVLFMQLKLLPASGTDRSDREEYFSVLCCCALTEEDMIFSTCGDRLIVRDYRLTDRDVLQNVPEEELRDCCCYVYQTRWSGSLSAYICGQTFCRLCCTRLS